MGDVYKDSYRAEFKKARRPATLKGHVIKGAAIGAIAEGVTNTVMGGIGMRSHLKGMNQLNNIMSEVRGTPALASSKWGDRAKILGTAVASGGYGALWGGLKGAGIGAGVYGAKKLGRKIRKKGKAPA